MRTDMTGRGGRAGMTLIEVLVALVILSGSLMAMGNFMGKFTHAEKKASLRADAIDIASDMMDSVAHDSVYTKVAADFQGTATVTRDNLAFKRVTTVKQIGGGVLANVNYLIVTTAVTPMLAGPDSIPTVKKSVIIRPF